MTRANEMAGELFAASVALEAIDNLFLPGDVPEPQSDDCCGDIGSAHEHGRELGWQNAVQYVRDTLEGEA